MNAKNTIFVSAFFFLLFCFPNYALLSQVSDTHALKQNQSEIIRLFDQAAVKHKKELYDLHRSRAARSIYLHNVSSENVAEVLSVRKTKYSPDATYLEKTAVLFYSYENEVLQVWLVDERGIQAYHKQKISEKQINGSIKNFRNSLGVDSLQLARSPHLKEIKTVSGTTKNKQPINHAVTKLTEILLPASIRNKLISARHLIIVPVLGFSTVPYAILQPFTDGSFLIDKMSISVAPSLFDVGQTIYHWEAEYAFSSPLIVGNPYLPMSEKWIVPPLPGAEKEALAVAKIMSAIPLTGKKATKEAIVSKAKDSSILYFATHGVASSRNPLSSGFLMLSADKFEQGWWTAKEIQESKLSKAEIAVLSACQTGLGKVHDAGIIGLARAFQIAGVRRVVMSLWSVDDVATNELMQAFVKHLQSKNDIPAEALRKAMLELKKRYPEPSQWASFVLFGTPR